MSPPTFRTQPAPGSNYSPMKNFSFIHTADLHLDSPFSGLRQVDGEIASLLKDATFRAFDNVVELALKNEVDFLLVAGDVYDAADRSLRAQLKFADGLKKLANGGIRSFVCHGNHDPLDGWIASLQWPEVSNTPVKRPKPWNASERRRPWTACTARRTTAVAKWLSRTRRSSPASAGTSSASKTRPRR